jgi:hypothetical protein
MGSPRRLLQQLQACLHSLCGWVLFRAGCRLRARKHYERVLQLRGSDFGAYVHLGRIAFAIGDYAGWRREFEHARRADPARFVRLRHPFELFEPRLAGTSFEDGKADCSSHGDNAGFRSTGDRATWRSLLFGPSSKNAGGRRSEGGADETKLPEPRPASSLDAGLDALLASGGSTDPLGLPEPGAPASRTDDCSTPSERRRFRELGPIARRELTSCDLEELARRLSG